ncbi:MAG: LptF/LptG family permease [Acidobacteriota bacterium]
MFQRRPSRKLILLLFREILPLSVIPFIALTTLVFIQQAGKYLAIVLSFNTSAQTKLIFLGSLVPGIVVITLPVSLLLGAVIACSRLSADGELTASQSLGISPLALASPFAIVGLLGSAFAFYLSANVAPVALKSLKSVRANILLQEATSQITPGAFTSRFPGLLLYVKDVDPKTGDWLGVFLMQRDDAKKKERLLTAERGQLRIAGSSNNSLEVQLLHGLTVEKEFKESGVNSQAASAFVKSSLRPIDNKPDEPDGLTPPSPLAEMSLRDVVRAAKSSATPQERLQAVVEWHKRLAFPFACFTLPLIAFVIALRGRQLSTRPRTAVAVIFVAMLFYVIMVAGQSLATSGKVPAWIGVWSAHLLYGVFIVLAFARNKHLGRTGWLSGSLTDLFSSLLPTTAQTPTREATITTSLFSSNSWLLSLSPINLINYLLISEIIKYYAIALTALVVTSVAFTLFDLIPSIIKSGTSFGYAMSYFGYLTPQLAYYVSPFALLVAILMGCGILARTNQLVVLFSAGQSKLRVMMAILMAVAGIGGGLWLLSDGLIPFTNREQDIRYNKIKGRQLEQTTIAFGRKWVIGKNNVIYSFQQIDAQNSLINGSIYYLSPGTHLLERSLHFNSAAQTSVNQWQAKDGWAEILKPDLTLEQKPLGITSLPFMVEDGAGIFKRTVNESAKMSTSDLQNYIRQLRSVGAPTIESRLDLRKRVAFPFSCLTLGILALPFALTKRARRYSPLLSIAVSIGIGLVFWLLMTLFEAAGKQSNLPVGVAVWGPQILFLAIGLYLNFRQRAHA